MEQPETKRSLFGAFKFFLGNATIPTESDDGAKADPQNKGDSSLPSAVSDSTFESPAKLASTAQMQGRKYHQRPQGPSSKLAQNLRMTDFTRPDSFTASNSTNFNMPAARGTPKRMPGDNPNKYATVSASTAFRSASSCLATAPTTRSIARPSTARRPGILFSPRIPAQTMRASFPQTTPSKAAFNSAAVVNAKNWNNGEAQEFFNMRIPSPPQNLTGELLSREVPKNHDRPGSIYADEFLSHYCPPDFDDLERRQFFCILDLRRLKYVADEVFTSKDWKINISNFAAEYNKSRSLIMLRYGLYEFKTIRASESVKKDWMAKHGIETSDDEGKMSGAKPSVGSKRKADEQLTPNDGIFAASPLNANKRARGAERFPLQENNVMASNKNKRRAPSVESDDDQPTKQQKQYSGPSPPKNAPSATKSMFEKIANSKTASKSSSAETPSKSGPFAPGNGTISAGANPTVTNNIFGHLSASANDDVDADSGNDTDSGGEAEESQVQKDESSTSLVKQRDIAPLPNKPSGGKSAQSNGASNVSSSDAGDSTKPRSIFERLSYGNDGQPMRKPTPQPPTPLVREKPVSPAKVAPADQTWSTTTPIKFAPAASQANSAFSAPMCKPAFGTALFGDSSTKKVEGAAEVPEDQTTSAFSASANKPAFGTPLFGAASAKKAEDVAEVPEDQTSAFSVPASKPALGTPLFGAASAKKTEDAAEVPGDKTTSAFSAPPDSTPESTVNGASIFGSSTTPVTTASKLFGSTTPAFGQAENKDSSKPAASTPGALFGVKPPTFTGETPNAFVSSTTASATALFTNAATPTERKDQSQLGTPSTEKKDQPLFGAAAKKDQPLFGASEKKDDQLQFGTPLAEASKGIPKPTFGETTRPVFGASGPPSIFGSQPKTGDGTGDKPSIFSSSTLFGAKTEIPKNSSTTKIFGAKDPAENASPTVSTMGASPFATNTATGGIFGAAKPPGTSTTTPAEQPSAKKRSLFAGQSATQKPTFGQSSIQKPAFGTPGHQSAGTMFGATSSANDDGDQEPPAKKAIFATSSNTGSNKIFGFSASNSTPAVGNEKPSSGSGASLFGQKETTEAPSIFANDVKGGTGSAGGSFQFPSLPSTANNSFAFGNNNNAVPGPATFSTNTISFDFGAGSNGSSGSEPPLGQTAFVFGSGEPVTQLPPRQPFSFTGNQAAANPSLSFGAPTSGPTFGLDTSQPAGPAANMFTVGGLAPAGGTSTGTNTPFTFGGASSLATTPVAGTPEPGGEPKDEGKEADGGDAQQEQISLTEQGLGEEDEDVVAEFRVKALKLVTALIDSEETPAKDKKSPWKVQGVGPLRILKHKTTGVVRLLLRADPSGKVALNKPLYPDFTYELESEGAKLVKFTTMSDDGKGLETWLLQVKTAERAKELAEALEANKGTKS